MGAIQHLCLAFQQLQEQVERLAKLNQSLHQKNELIQAHAQSLMKEKSQIISEMKAMEKDMPLQNSTSQEESTQNSDHTSQTQVLEISCKDLQHLSYQRCQVVSLARYLHV